MRDFQTYFVVDLPSPFSEASSVTHEKCPSDEIYRAFTMGHRHRKRRAKMTRACRVVVDADVIKDYVGS